MGLPLSLKYANKPLLIIGVGLMIAGVAALVYLASNGQKNAPSSPAPTTQDPPEKVLLADAFDGTDQLLATAPIRPQGCVNSPSNLWEISNGSLFIRNNTGYSGLPSEGQPVHKCPSIEQAGSHTFRMHSRQSFDNFKLSLDYQLLQHGGAGGSDHSYDGLHLWVRHESQYALYAISIARWDGVFAIKKKLPVEEIGCADPANEGCYNDIARQIRRPELLDRQWHHAEVTVRTTDNNVDIELKIDGDVVLSGRDNGTTFGRIIPTGAVGVRGDNTEFSIKNLKVSSP